MKAPLTVAVAQPACRPYDVAANAQAHAAAIRDASARIVVFPELSITGYELDAPPIDASDDQLHPIVEACEAAGSLALVGAPVQSVGGRVHIAMLAIDGGGVRVAYRKIWIASGEARFSPGPEPVALPVDGWRLGLGICRDTGVPQHQTDTAALGTDAYLAGTLMFDHETVEQNERARRIATDHRVWVAFASFAGPTGAGYERTAGRSGIWAPDGTVVAQAGPEAGAVVSATLS
jgi:predicted amidohydrolase